MVWPRRSEPRYGGEVRCEPMPVIPAMNPRGLGQGQAGHRAGQTGVGRLPTLRCDVPRIPQGLEWRALVSDAGLPALALHGARKVALTVVELCHCLGVSRADVDRLHLR